MVFLIGTLNVLQNSIFNGYLLFSFDVVKTVFSFVFSNLRDSQKTDQILLYLFDINSSFTNNLSLYSCMQYHKYDKYSHYSTTIVMKSSFLYNLKRLRSKIPSKPRLVSSNKYFHVSKLQVKNAYVLTIWNFMEIAISSRQIKIFPVVRL